MTDINAHKVDHASTLNASVAMLSMVAERYLEIEASDSEKMALEITAGWNCRPVVD